MKKLEILIKKHLKGLKRTESKTLVQYLDAEERFVCGYSEKPKQTNFYFQPLYDEPQMFKDLKKDLKPYLKGKSCLHLPADDGEALAVVEKLLKVYLNKK